MNDTSENLVTSKSQISKYKFKRYIMLLIISLLGFAMLFTGCIFVAQRSMIYFPQGYPPAYKRGLPKGTVEVKFNTSLSGEQTAFYVPPLISSDDTSTTLPEKIWFVFGGNGSTALGWLDFVENYPHRNTAFYLIDYPGYGLCNGRPKRKTIIESIQAAREALPGAISMSIEDVETRTNLLAHSIGTAVALEYAVRYPSNQIILISPFTSLFEMAKRSVGLPLAWLLLDRFDNRARLDELTARQSVPDIFIIHGTADDIVPFKMGRELADSYSDKITFIPFEGGDHNWIIESAQKQIQSAMSGIDTSAVNE